MPTPAAPELATAIRRTRAALVGSLLLLPDDVDAREPLWAELHRLLRQRDE